MNPFAAKVSRTLLVLALLSGPTVVVAQQAGNAGSEKSVQPAGQTDASKPTPDLPESPGAMQSANQNSNSGTVNTPPSQAAPAQPSGTAAAPAVQISGNAVSRPAGAAIAPPRQRRVRSFLIKTGLIAGVGVAVGTVAALSASSPGRVPGSH